MKAIFRCTQFRNAEVAGRMYGWADACSCWSPRRRSRANGPNRRRNHRAATGTRGSFNRGRGLGLFPEKARPCRVRSRQRAILILVLSLTLILARRGWLARRRRPPPAPARAGCSGPRRVCNEGAARAGSASRGYSYGVARLGELPCRGARLDGRGRV